MEAQSVHQSKSGRQYTEEEWERVRLPFRHYYIEKRMSLKDAAQKIRDEYQFEATPRQWERRIGPDKWNLPKYANREERLRVVEESGTTLESLSGRGRRRSTGSPDERLLGDRNMRRWARRELSRDPNRRRAKSVGEMSDVSDQEMSTAAPSPAPSDYAMDDLPQPQFDDFWPPSDHSSQATQPNLPHIHVDRVQDIPQITLSNPDETAEYIAPSPAPMTQQIPVGMQYTMPHKPGDFQEMSDLNHVFRESQDLDDAIIPQPGYNWNAADPFGQNQQGEVFPQLPQDSQESYVDMLDEKSGRIPYNDDVSSFTHTTLTTQVPVSTPISHEDEIPDFDTYSDVHNLLQDHYSSTMQMIGHCMQSCVRSGASYEIMQMLRLLESGMRAQNDESDRNIRNTLKNIASTQRQSTRSIFDLSKARKKKIDDLKAEVEDLRAQQGTFTYG